MTRVFFFLFFFLSEFSVLKHFTSPSAQVSDYIAGIYMYMYEYVFDVKLLFCVMLLKSP